MSITRITIAIITYQRPQHLAPTLAAIAALQVPANSALSIVVIDNDAAQSAAPVIQAIKDSPFPLRYVCEPQKGRGFARNCALDETLGEDYLAFIDDDIHVAPDWLTALLQCCVQHQAQFCAGNLAYHYPQQAPNWARNCRLLQSKATGKAVGSAATGNLLIDRRWIAAQGLRFPLGIAAEDMFFTTQAHRHGALIMTCVAAHATTQIEIERLNLAWVWRRAMRNGANRSTLYRRLDGRGAMIACSCYHAVQMFFFASGAAMLACARQRPWVRVVEHAGMGMGYLAGMMAADSVIRFNS